MISLAISSLNLTTEYTPLNIISSLIIRQNKNRNRLRFRAVYNFNIF